METETHNLFYYRDLYLLDCLARDESERTVEGKTSSLNMFMEWCIGEEITDVHSVDDLVLEQYRHYLRGYRFSRNKSLDAATKYNRLTAVKVFIKRLFELRKVASNSTSRFRLPKKPRRLPKGVLNKEELDDLLAQSLLHGEHAVRDRAIFETFYASALRRMELANLKTDDVDLERGLVRIEQGKGKKDRVVPIALRACEWIEEYRTKHRHHYCNYQSGKTLFLNDSGRRFKERQLSRLARSYLSRAGIDKPGACNVLRHTSATHLLEGGADIRVIQEFLGHADISTTQIYAHVSIRKLEQDYHRAHPASLEYQSPRDIKH